MAYFWGVPYDYGTMPKIPLPDLSCHPMQSSVWHRPNIGQPTFSELQTDALLKDEVVKTTDPHLEEQDRK